MYQQIKSLAEEALRLQNKNFMDETFKKIIAICDDAPAHINFGPNDHVRVTYGEAIQMGRLIIEKVADEDAQPVLPLPEVSHENPAVLDEQPQSILGERNAEADAIVTVAVDAQPEEALYVFDEVTKEGDLMLDDVAIFVTDSAIHVDTTPAESPFAAPAEPAGAELAEIEEMTSAAMKKPFEAAPRDAVEAIAKQSSKKVRGAK